MTAPHDPKHPRNPRVEVIDKLRQSFDKSELRVLAFHVGVDFDDLRGDTLSELVGEFVAFCERRQLLDGLLEAVKLMRPNQDWPGLPWTTDTRIENTRTPLTNRRPPVLAEHFGVAWADWVRELASTDVRVGTTVVRCQERLSATREHIRWLHTCKNVHLQLHELQFQCYNMLVSEIEAFPITRNRSVLQRIRNYLIRLDQVTGALEKAYQDAPLLALDTLCFNRLGIARERIQLLLDLEDVQYLHGAIEAVQIVVNQYPKAVDGQLKLLPSQINLQAVVEALRNIAETARMIDSERVQEMEHEIDKLRDFEQALQQVIDEHNRWQDVDNKLQLIASRLELGVESCKLEWEIIGTHAVHLYHERADQWALDLRKFEQQFSAAMREKNQQRAQEAFDSYHSIAALRFLGIDHKLLDHCNELNCLDGPLSSLIGVVV
jgi:ribonuclease HI